MSWKRAVCNEMFGTLDFSQSCALLQKYGFTGMEIAPFTISDDQGHIAESTIKMVQDSLKNHGLQFTGFHWLFSHPAGFETTAKDIVKQQKATNHLKYLLDVASALGGGNLIFGSPKQRHVSDTTPAEGRKRLEAFLGNVADYAESCNSVICIEALSAKDTNVLNVLEEAEILVKNIGSPAIQSMFDFHNCTDETLRWEELIQRYYPIIKHIHLNDPHGNHPRVSESDNYTKAFKSIKELSYSEWVSLEIFTVPEDPERVLRETKDFLNLFEVES